MKKTLQETLEGLQKMIPLKNPFFLVPVFLFALFFFLPPSVARSREDSPVARDAYTPSAVCGKCHVQIYERWKKSLHAHAFDEPIFDTAYTLAYRKTAGKARKICLPCHAPTVRSTADMEAKLPLTREGVTCDFCHTVKGVDLQLEDPFLREVGFVKRGPFKEAKGLEGKHDIAYSPLHGKAEFCAGCHEYRSKKSVPIIGTYSEWKAGPYAAKGKQCQNCHMPVVMGRIVSSRTRPKRALNEHNLLGGHSLNQLQKAVEVKIIAVNVGAARTEVMVDITNRGSGHKVPTGVPTRRLALNVEVTARGGRVFRDKIIYEKVLANLKGRELRDDSEIMLGDPMQIIKDNRIKPGETRREVFTFYETGARLKNATAWVDYTYKPRIMDRTSMQIEMARDSKALH